MTAHIYLKDCITNKESGKRKYVPIGELGLRDQLKALISDGYRGFVSIETHFSPKARRTRECLEGLLGILGEIGEGPE